MATLKDVQKVAKKMGAKVTQDKDGNTWECRVEAPNKTIWCCSDIHEIISSSFKPWKPDYQDLLDRMKYGLAKCKDDECEWCNS